MMKLDLYMDWLDMVFYCKMGNFVLLLEYVLVCVPTETNKRC